MWGLAYQTWPIYNSSSETKTTSTSPEVQSCPLLFPQNIYHTETSDSLCRIILIWYQVVGKGAGHEAGSLGTTMRSRRRHTFGYFLHRSRPHHSWLCWIHSCALPTEEGNTQSNKEMTRFSVTRPTSTETSYPSNRCQCGTVPAKPAHSWRLYNIYPKKGAWAREGRFTVKDRG